MRAIPKCTTVWGVQVLERFLFCHKATKRKMYRINECNSKLVESQIEEHYQYSKSQRKMAEDLDAPTCKHNHPMQLTAERRGGGPNGAAVTGRERL